MTKQLQNKIALITGGGSGIGRATAVLFAQEGAAVAIADIDADGGMETVQMVADQGSDAFFIQTDVSNSVQVQAMVGEVVERYGRLDIAFNNAGIEGETCRTADVTEEDFDRIIAVNLKGVWLCMKVEIPQMLAQGGGVIVNTASAAGLVGTYSMPVYGASKHGIVGLSKSAAVEYGRENIRVNAICPSVIETPMVERAFEIFPQFVEATKRLNPMRRLGQADEVARAVLWLASDAASFTNGAALTIDGGFTAQ
ncbi:MAG: SDR family oxidoreductase [Chloroflexi bacterium]|nr:SDR family oxidoreductase [Chloroflexota bacterium]